MEQVNVDTLTQVMGPIYSAAHYLGLFVVSLVKRILPMVENLDSLADPVGFLAILTILVILTATIKKVAFIIVLVGWGLILIRILLMAFKIA
jgi:hypothetical protein